MPVAIVLSYKVGSVISRCQWYGGGGKRPRSLPRGLDPTGVTWSILFTTMFLDFFLTYSKGTGLELIKCESL